MNVAIEPTRLMTERRCQPTWRCERWNRNIPNCESVKLVNTPTA